MDLVVTVLSGDISRGEQRRCDVRIDAEEGATIGDLAAALCAVVPGLTLDPAMAGLGTAGREIDPNELLANSQLGDGTTVELRPSSLRQLIKRANRAAPVLLRSTSGRLDGESFPVAFGESVLGRSRTCDVLIDDPSIGREHARITITDQEVLVTDLGSTNGTRVNTGAVIVAPMTLRHGDVLVLGACTLEVLIQRPQVNAAVITTPDGLRIRNGVLPLNRPPRIEAPYQGRHFVVPAPPEEMQKQRLPFLAAIAPLILGAVMYAVTKNVLTLGFLLLSPVMLVGSALENRRSMRKDFAEKLAAFRTRISEIGVEITAEQTIEVQSRRSASPSIDEALSFAVARARLFERGPGDADFGAVRLGLGERPTLQTFESAFGGSDAIRKAALSDMPRRYQLVSDVPIIARLDGYGLGIAADRDAADDLARAAITQLAVLHSHAEVAIAGVFPAERADRWDWLKWLPHTRSVSSPLPGSHLAVGDSQCDEMLRRLRELIDRIGSEKGSDKPDRPDKTTTKSPILVLIVDQDAPVDLADLTSILTEGAAHGIGFIWVGSDPMKLPRPCHCVLLGDQGARIGDVRSHDDPAGCRGVRLETLDLGRAKGLARSLAPLRDATSRDLTRDLPARVPLVELIGGAEALSDPQVIARRWALSRSFAGPLGVAPGEEFGLDLVQNGPHGFIVGTTGAGKSELLRTLLLSLAASVPPERLGFLLIDFKGGAALQPLAALPHTVGLVTNLRPNSENGDALTELRVRRTLAWLRAELNRRMQLLSVAGVSDLRDLESGMLDAVPYSVPPRLLIVADEFAVLARQSDRGGAEVIDEMVDVARLGRSLGIHLILATQQASGVITPKIRVNTNLRIALRVQDPAESDDVVGTIAAAHVPQDRPGRAYVRVGNQQPRLIQSAVTIGSTLSEAGRPPSIDVHSFAIVAQDFAAPERIATPKTGPSAPEDVAALTRSIHAAASAGGRPGRPSLPWTNPLPDLLALSELPTPKGTRTVAFGRIDDPGAQAERLLSIDLDQSGSAIFFGATGSGKTVALRTIALALARGAGPRELNIIGLDFAGRGLDALAPLPQVASIVPGDDIERITRTLRTLSNTIARRNERFKAVNASTLTEYQAQIDSGPDLDRLVVLIDGYMSFSQAFDRVDGGRWVDLVPQLALDGRQVGVHFFLTSDRRVGLTAPILSATSHRFVLRMPSVDEYGALDVDVRNVAGLSQPGRGLVGGLEFQVALAVSADHRREFENAARAGQADAVDRILAEARAGDAQRAAIQEIVTSSEHAANGLRAVPVGRLATTIRVDDLPAPVGTMKSMIGISDTTLRPVEVDLASGPLLISGPPRSGKTATLAALAYSLSRSNEPPALYFAAATSSALHDAPWWTGVSLGLTSTTLSDMAEQPIGSSGAVIFVDDAVDFEGTEVDQILTELLSRSATEKICIVAAAELDAAKGAYNSLVKGLRRFGRGILLNVDPIMDGSLIGARLPNTPHRYVPGRGFLCLRSTTAVVQVGWWEGTAPDE